jgi:LPXTG-motif cell wall-anchored protein
VALPSTGTDTSPITWAVLVLAAGGLVILTVTRRRPLDHSGMGVPT